jgi:hypothetical protein
MDYKIFILESLRAKDPKTGEEVYSYLKSKKIESTFFCFKSVLELQNILTLIKVECSNSKKVAFVHIDCHGNEKGIGVVKDDESEELIKWDDLSDIFRSIYLATNRKSVICLSSCNGFNAMKMVAYNRPCPYDHICGSLEKISFSDSLKGYKLFYNLIALGKSIYDSAVEVHNNKNFKNLKFIGLNAKTLFQLAIDGYIKKECTIEKLEERKGRAIKELTDSGNRLSKEQISVLNISFSLEGQKEILNKYIDTFLS